MADIATIWDPAEGFADWVLSVNTLDIVVDELGDSILDELHHPIEGSAPAFIPGQGLLAGQDLRTAVIISLFTDASAGVDDAINDGSGDPRGWWADDTIGSKIWLRYRSKKSDALLALVQDDLRTALAWMIEDEVAAAIDVSVAWTSPNLLGCEIVIRRHDGTNAAMKFDWAWEGL